MLKADDSEGSANIAPKARSRRLALRDTLLATAAPMLSLTYVIGLGTMWVFISDGTSLADSSLGMLAASFFLSSAVFSTTGSWLSRRYGAVRALQHSMVVVGISMVTMAVWGPSVAGILVGAIMAGAANGLIQPPANVLIARRIRAGRQGLAFGVKQSAFPVGGFLVGAGVPLVVIPFGWRAFYVGVGLTAFLLAAALSVMESARPHPGATARTTTESPAAGILVRLLLIGCLGALLGNAMTAYFVPSSIHHGVSVELAALIFGAGSTVGVLSRVVLGGAVDRWPWNPWRIVAAQFGVWSVGLVFLAVGSSRATVAIAAVLGFGFGWGWPGLFHLSLSRLGPDGLAATTGIAMLGVYVGGITGPAAFGILVERLSYGAAWGILAALAAIGALISRDMLRVSEKN